MSAYLVSTSDAGVQALLPYEVHPLFGPIEGLLWRTGQHRLIDHLWRILLKNSKFKRDWVLGQRSWFAIAGRFSLKGRWSASFEVD